MKSKKKKTLVLSEKQHRQDVFKTFSSSYIWYVAYVMLIVSCIKFNEIFWPGMRQIYSVRFRVFTLFLWITVCFSIKDSVSSSILCLSVTDTVMLQWSSTVGGPVLFKAGLKGCLSPPSRWGESNCHSLLTKCPFATMDGDRPHLPDLMIFFFLRDFEPLNMSEERFHL